jgi:hypothetical protein
MFGTLSTEIGRQLRKRGVSERGVLADFVVWRKAKREAGKNSEAKLRRATGRGR